MSCECGNNNCADGIDGLNSFTYTSANFTQPAVSSNVTVSVNINGQNTGLWAAVGQVIFIVGGGYYQVVSHSTLGDTITVTNLGYTGNAVATTVIASGSAVSPSGIKGVTGDAGAAGATGAAGTNGVSVKYAADDAELKSGTSAANYTLYAMPQATFAVNGSELDIDATFSFLSSHDTFTLFFKIGAVDLLLPTVPGLTISDEIKVTNCRVTGTIKRRSATSVRVIWTITYYNDFTTVFVLNSSNSYQLNLTTATAVTDLDTGGTQNVGFARSSTVGATDITMEYFTVRYANKS